MVEGGLSIMGGRGSFNNGSRVFFNEGAGSFNNAGGFFSIMQRWPNILQLDRNKHVGR